jgi:CRISPR-associated endonuclease/helicase Cas3
MRDRMHCKHLLAKSSKDPENPKPEETLVGHTRAVLSAADEINNILSDSIPALFDKETDPTFWTDALFFAAWLHDLGKANDHFQKAVRNRNSVQGIRHESLGIVVADQFLKPMIGEVRLRKKHPEWFWHAIVFALAGHHLKFPDRQERSGLEVTFLGDHPHMNELLDIGYNRFGLRTAAPCPPQPIPFFLLGGLGRSSSG